MKYPKLMIGIVFALTLTLTGCVGAVVGVAVDTTVAVGADRHDHHDDHHGLYRVPRVRHRHDGASLEERYEL